MFLHFFDSIVQIDLVDSDVGSFDLSVPKQIVTVTLSQL